MKRRTDRSSKLRWSILAPIATLLVLVGFLLGFLAGQLV